MGDFWNYWSFKTDAKGRQVWDFSSPNPTNAWDSEEGKVFLAEMQRAFTFDKKANPNSADLVYRRKQSLLNRNLQDAPPNNVTSVYQKGTSYYTSLQSESGHWPGDYGGPHFLAPGLIIASYVTESPLPAAHQVLIKQYFLNHQNEDGGWGLHIEDKSTMFGTVLQYVALRLLGLTANEPAILKARNWIHKHGGATGIPSWGKFYLSVLGVYEWEGCNSLFPEMWLMPESLPFHPSKYWCHARMVYLPMAYCYGLKVTGKVTPLITELRKEIYTERYEDIDWQKARNHCTPTDLYHHPAALLKLLNTVTNAYEKVQLPSLRKRATNFILDYIKAEDEQTNYIDIGPVNQVINSICVWHAYGKASEAFKKHSDRWFDYLWVAEDGMKMNGYNGSQFWDTAFAMQAMMESYQPEADAALRKAYQYIEKSQVTVEVNDSKKFYRHPSVGGFPFSNAEHGWPITDCSAEGLKVALQVKRLGFQVDNPISDLRLKQSADLLLSLQNKDGGWASYELTRGPKWLELLNPSEIFGNIMIDHSYTECSSACIQALHAFKQHFPAYKPTETQNAIEKGIQFILSQQRADGSWYGSWAVCFTYGTWFAIEALMAVSLQKQTPEIKNAIDRACAFLLSKQEPDGGWGESFESCLKKEYVPHRSSQIINTSWALLTLMAAGHTNKAAIDKGIGLLLSRQMDSGDFPQEGISGVFNHSCGISYTAYRNVFPIWALGRYVKTYLNK
ncbi:MAG: terpene cyclase/mutase family protein [Bacteroidota bacterium]